MNASVPNKIIHENRILDVFDRHVAAFFSGNLDDIMRDFTDHSIVISPDGIFEGTEQIRQLYAGLLVEFGNINAGDSPGIHIDILQVRGDLLYITWHAESIQHRFEFGTDSFICQNDKFVRQTISYPAPLPK